MNAIKTDAAPSAIGPYSQATVANGFVFTSGQLGVVPATGEFVGETALEQAEQVMKNLSAVLEAAGSSLGKAVKATVFLSDMSDFAEVNEVYKKYFSEPYPARSCVQVAALPKGGKVEVELVAAL